MISALNQRYENYVKPGFEPRTTYFLSDHFATAIAQKYNVSYKYFGS